VQVYTVFSGGIVSTSNKPENAAALLRFLASPEAVPAVTDSGMEPIPAK
jgi:molybdate transport system substrate-binding protein